MTYGTTLKDALKTYVFDRKAIQHLADNPKATSHGFITLVLVGIAYVVSQLLNALLYQSNTEMLDSTLPGVIAAIAALNFVLVLVGFFVCYGIFHAIAKACKGKGTAGNYFRTLSNALFPYVIVIIPLLGDLIGTLISIYLIAVNVYLLKTVHGFTTGRALLVGLVPVIIIVIVLMLFAPATMNAAGTMVPGS